MEFEALTQEVIGLAIKVQKVLGPGLLESAYRACMAYELRKAGHLVDEERPLELRYEELTISNAYRLDIVVDDLLILELKTVEKLAPTHEAQLATYLRMAGKRVGLIFNFWAWPLKDGGIKRVVHTP
ncbi:MAG TPA: GxxExxY protein [Holophagaceae bacterium]|nr:GxxExxY protein [Holophagaceae bacterium]